MRRLILVLAIANLGQAPAPKGGTVTGTIVATRGGAPIPANKVEHLWVYLESTTKVGRPVGKDVVAWIEQKGLTFTPPVTLIPTGATVFFPNRDSEVHNVYSPSTKDGDWLGFNLGRYNTHKIGRKQKFGRAGEFDIYCDIHVDMVATVKVVPSRYFTKVVDGRYTLTDIAPGVYNVLAWSPDNKPTTIAEAVEVQLDATKQVRPMNFVQEPWAKEHTHYDKTPYARCEDYGGCK